MSLDRDYSGRLSLRVPKSLHRALTIRARAEGVNLNKFATAALAFAVEWNPRSRYGELKPEAPLAEVAEPEAESEDTWQKPAAVVEAERAQLRRLLRF